MELTVKLAFIFIFFLTVTLNFTKCDLRVVVTPDEINLGLSPTLNVNCTFAHNGISGMTALISLILSRANDSGSSFQELASINEYSNGKVSLLTSENITASGQLRPTGESYLHLQWENPLSIHGGVYKCIGQGLDLTGHVIVMTDAAQVTVHNPTANDYNEKFMTTFSDMMSSLESYQHSLQQTAQQMGVQMMQMENEVNTCRTTMTDQITTLEQTVLALREKILPLMFLLPLSYKNHSYYVTKEGFVNINKSMNNCSMVGGYLAVIDDADEYNAMKTFLGSLSGISEVIISGSDEATDGTWLLPSGKPVPYLMWHSGQPDGGTSEQCLTVCYISGGPIGMCDLACAFDISINVQYMCEIENM